MHLYLLRHANADTIAPSDDARLLSEKGMMQAVKVARFCEAHGIQPSLVLTSPVRRAHDTAQIVAAHLRAEMMIVPWLACGMSPSIALDELRAFRSHGSVMIVGHEPDFSSLIAHLLGTPSGENVAVKKASLTLLEVETLARGAARLDFFLPSRLM